MSAPLIVVVLVAVGDAHDPSVVSMTTSAEEALGPGTIVVVREMEAKPNDGDAETLGDALHADALVEVSWPDADRHRADLHVHPSKTANSWADREISFAPNDATVERGRTLGFAVASMIPAPSPETPKTETPSPPTTLPPVTTVAPARDHAETPATTSATTAPVGLELVGVASTGASAAWGGEIGARIDVARDFALRIGGGVRFGALDAATASSSTTRIDAGIAWDFAHAASRRLAFAFRLDALVLRDALTRTDRDERGARWLPGAGAFLEGAWSFTAGGALVVGLGPEVAFGKTSVYVGDATVASLPPVRFLATLGVRARF